MQDRRQEPRQRMLRPGRIFFSDRLATMPCTIRNVSRHGAMLLVTATQGLPDHFALEIAGVISPHSCRVVWRQERRLGVRFG